MDLNAALTGCVWFKRREIAFFAFEPEDAPDRSTLLVFADGNWNGYRLRPQWPVVGMACAKYPGSDTSIVLATSTEGRLWELVPDTARERELEIGGDYSGITGLATIDNAIWACGMGRLVLRREANGAWTDISAPPAGVADGVIGFNAVAGAGAGESVAVGWKGEIWLRRDNRWDAQDSGTDSNLNAVSVAADGEVVVVGDEGVVVVGRRDEWSVLNVNSEFNLQGVCHFGKEVFVCSDFEIFRLENETLVPETRFADSDEPETCMHLLAGPQTAFSQGERDIFRYVNGAWNRVY